MVHFISPSTSPFHYAGVGWDGRQRHFIITILRYKDPEAMGMSLSKLWEMVKDRGAWELQSTGLQRDGHDLTPEQRQTEFHQTSLLACIDLL